METTETETEGRTLVRIALTRLPELQTASGLFRETARIEGVEDSGPVTPLLSAAVVLLGLGRTVGAEISQPFSTGALRTRILGELGQPGTTPGELGLALWAETRIDGTAVGEIEGRLERQAAGDLDRVPTEQLAWVISGLAEAAQLRGGGEAGLLGEALTALRARTAGRSGLLRDLPHRLRGSTVPVTGQFHALHTLCQLVRAGLGGEIRETAQRLAERLLSLQRDDGGWPGLIDPVRGEAAAWYPALAVTHLAVAPIALRAAGEIGLEGDFGAATGSGIGWARGGNPLGFDLVHERENRLDRGIMPRRDTGAFGRSLDLVGRRIRGSLPEPAPDRLILDPTVSSDDLGWVLEAWTGR